MKRLDLVGQKFSRLTVMSFSHIDRHGKAMWNVRCDCGNESVVMGLDLRRGHTRSCGCFQRESRAKVNLKHGHGSRQNQTPEYITWGQMIQRCTNPNDIMYPYYGGNGVKVCKRWRGEHGFENFLADVGPRPQGKLPSGKALYSIGRFDDEGNYEPGNVKWMTAKEQGVERR